MPSASGVKMRKPRHLSPDERALWDHVARQIDPQRAETPAMPVEFAAPKRKPTPAQPTPFAAFELGSKATPPRPTHQLAPSIGQTLTSAPLSMDAKTHGKMVRGKLRPDARIDLHGMTMAEAHPALTGFILSEHAAGSRMVLVITGKGKLRDDLAPMPVRKGILRHQVPQWLTLAPLRQVVLQVSPANIRHGGEGAYYVYLRRRR